MMKNYYYLSVMCCALLAVSCQEEEMGFSQEEIFRGTYERSFVNQFGNIDPNQTWDFSTRGVTDTYVSVAETEGDDAGYYVVEDATLSWMKNQLPEKNNNKSKGKSFTFQTPFDLDCELVPIYQGGADYDWKISIVLNGEKTQIWRKGQNLQAKYSKNEKWVNVGNGNSSNNYQNKTESAVAVRSTPVPLHIPANATIYFEVNNLNYSNRKGTSIQTNPWIFCLEGCPIPEKIKEEHPTYEVKIISCECYSVSNDEKPDFNEGVFLLIGDPLPDVIYQETEVTVTDMEKRFMIEDFGTVDFDFNDIVVDVKQETTATYLINPQTGEKVVKDGTTPVTKQYAKITYLCGTYPHQVTVGNYAFNCVSDPTNQEQTLAQLNAASGTHTAPAASEISRTHTATGWQPYPGADAGWVEITGFDANLNNISVKVWKNFEEETSASTVWTNTFPEPGATPFMVATKTSDLWVGEGADVRNATWWNP